ncbi:DUF2075 domain-containing protein [Candidatus Saccharibacteria bacterium]|nr:DUF2075 domain-containing protein [Candidatus Saccharibacteria bacterium]
MIIYSATKKQFSHDILANNIEQKVLASFVRATGSTSGKLPVSEAEIRSWHNSLMYMDKVVSSSDIPDNAGVAIEYRLPLSSKRVDFILTGQNEHGRDTAILVELKQWSTATATDKDGVVNTFVAKQYRDEPHPSYQVWSYAAMLENYNSTVQQDEIILKPCAYLHNYEPDDVINSERYAEYTSKAPVFLLPDAEKLQNFIKQYVKCGDENGVLYNIERGQLRPSKQLADSLRSMLEGNQEFILIDEQKVVYETALSLARHSSDEVKNVLIVEGGPGTGKSVVAVNLLVNLIQKGLVSQYVTRNAAPRVVFEAKLSGSSLRSQASHLFRSAFGYVDAAANEFDTLIVDEAHRLTEKSGVYGNLGENEVKEIINAAKFSVFFIDEDQKVTLKDIGSKDEIRKWARVLGATVTELELPSQFRCNGSDGYLAWLDDVLEVRETANTNLDGIDYEFRVYDSPHDLLVDIHEKNELNNKSRLVAGYCWDWKSAKNPLLHDIEIGDFTARWNLKVDGQAWLIKPNSVNEVGCIYTCQGLELDYVGVILGEDLVVRDGKVVTNALKRASQDRALWGYKGMHKENPEEAYAIADAIIKNTYRTLMTRGMKGCFIYSVDEETREYFKQQLLSFHETKLPNIGVDGFSVID